MRQVQTEVRQHRCRQAAAAIGQTVTDAGNRGQRYPLPAAAGMRQSEQHGSDCQRQPVASDPVLQPAADTALHIASEKCFFGKRHQQQIIEHP